MNAEPTVFVVDDDPDVRESLSGYLVAKGLRAATFGDAEAFLDAYGDDPGCLILDIRMPGMSGLELQQVLVERHVRIPVIFITAHGEVSSAVKAIKSGAVNFLEKPYQLDDLMRQVEDSIARDAQARAQREKLAAITARLRLLTPREREVLDLVVAGKPSKQIAVELGISKKTVDVHRAHILEKMQAGSLPELIRLALAPVPPEELA